ncbi:hypothetical protein FACS189449_04280 [Alphaproteobacteria bacterium]|nr:hypothetical protein FACS189449_04280 [Alphaproteobacteria bacterium]
MPEIMDRDSEKVTASCPTIIGENAYEKYNSHGEFSDKYSRASWRKTLEFQQNRHG